MTRPSNDMRAIRYANEALSRTHDRRRQRSSVLLMVLGLVAVVVGMGVLMGAW